MVQFAADIEVRSEELLNYQSLINQWFEYEDRTIECNIHKHNTEELEVYVHVVQFEDKEQYFTVEQYQELNALLK